MSCYVTIEEVKDHGAMSGADVDGVELVYPGLTLRIATKVSAEFDARLRKRYAAPFEQPYPDILILQVAREVAYRLYLKRGFNPGSQQDALIEKDHENAQAWLREAADSKDGLIELPVRQAAPPDVTAVNAGGPLFYSESSPYTWMDRQIEEVRNGR